MSEILTTVNEMERSDSRYTLRDLRNSEQFHLMTDDESLQVKFTSGTVSVYLEEGEEWADLYREPHMEVTITLESGGVMDVPRWLFEELYSIEKNDELRPRDEYLTCFKNTQSPVLEGDA